MQQDHQWPGGDGSVVVGVSQGLDALKPDAVGVDIVVAPRSRDTGYRWVGLGHHQPDGSAGAGSVVVMGAGAAPGDLKFPGVNAAVVSLTDAMVCCGPRMRRTLR